MQRVRSAAALRRCFPVLVQLRPHLTESSYVAQARRQAKTGYETACVVAEGRVVTVAGFRVWETLFSGRHMYVDDLVTDQAARSRDYGKAMISWLVDLARKSGCKTIELDSGTQRVDAHRFYLRERFVIDSFHFRRRLT